MGLIKTQLGSISPQQKSLLHKEEPVVEERQILYNESECLKTTFSTGFTHDDKPVVTPLPPIFNCKPPKKENEDSVMNQIETGFGECNTITKDCPKPKYKTHLFKENYLGEFKSETEKALARNNLGVYSKEETDKIISHIVIEEGLVSREEIVEMIGDLDFVDSTIRSNAQYDIPDKLFKL